MSETQSTEEALRLVEQDFVTYTVLLCKEWEHFAHFETPALEQDIYERIEGLQGLHCTYFAGGWVAFDAVESALLQARDLVNAHFTGAR